MPNDAISFLYEGDFGKISETTKEPREFRPWHKPRKQWVRSCQWKNSLANLVAKPEYRDITEISYFGFPGADCLDVRVLGKSLQNLGKKLCFYGLETDEKSAVQAQTITESLLHDAPFISERSKIEASSSFELLQQTNSKLTAEVLDREPFHIINLDFVDSVLSGQNTMPALNNLLRYQFERQYDPWMLFLTTRYDAQANPVKSLEAYVGVLEKNLTDHPEFNTAVNQSIFNLDPATVWDSQSLLATADHFENILLLSFLKWVLKNAHEKHVKMRLHPVAHYKVRERTEKSDMCSLVIEFNKVNHPTDATGINQAAPAIESELDFALRFVPRIHGARDIDHLMKIDQPLFDRMKAEMITLLDECGGYNTSAYPF